MENNHRLYENNTGLNCSIVVVQSIVKTQQDTYEGSHDDNKDNKGKVFLKCTQLQIITQRFSTSSLFFVCNLMLCHCPRQSKSIE